eukprot:4908222-Ditylum_brightwellii.AAC.1
MAITVGIWEKLGKKEHTTIKCTWTTQWHRGTPYAENKTCADMSLLHCLALLCCPWLTPWKTNCAVSKNKGAEDLMTVSQGAPASRPGCLI